LRLYKLAADDGNQPVAIECSIDNDNVVNAQTSNSNHDRYGLQIKQLHEQHGIPVPLKMSAIGAWRVSLFDVFYLRLVDR